MKKVMSAVTDSMCSFLLAACLLTRLADLIRGNLKDIGLL